MARPGGSGPPISFKTVPGRHRTQKWNVAKTYDYSGDDWGGYDAYDDYGYDSNPPAPQPAAPEQEQPVGMPSSQLPSQIPPQQQQQPRPGRQMSFEQGFTDERTQFAARPPPPLSTGPFPTSSQQNSRGVSPAISATSSGKRSGEYPPPPSGRARDFTNPEQVPPPLNTQSPRGSPALSAVSLPAPNSSSNFNNGGAAFPPRQSSMTSSSPTASEPAPSSAPAGAEKALPTPPFIRPSDIYKRMAAEREKERRASESESSRASMESASRGDGESPAPTSTSTRQQRPLSAVDEGPSVPEGFGEPVDRGVGVGAGSAGLPAVAGVSSFGSNWFGGGQQNTTTSSTAASDAASPGSLQTTPVATRAPAPFDSAAAVPPTATDSATLPSTTFSNTNPPQNQLGHQPSAGYRSVVNRAFDHGATSSSIPATPISRDNSQSTTAETTSGVSRSNTDSTSNISPIMSRVPSAGTAAARQQQQMTQQQGQEVPTIDEEPQTPPRDTSESSTVRDAGLAASGVAAAGAAAVGVAAGYRRNFDPPSSGASPARTPELGSGVDGGRRLSEGLAAETVTPTAPPSAPVVTTGVESATAPIMSEPATDSSRSIDTSSAAVPTPTLGRARAGTDYSMRESDIADAVNQVPSPEQPDAPTMSPTEAAHAERAEQNLFLRTHNTSTPTTPSQIVGNGGESPFGLPSPGIPRAATPGSGRASPARGVGMGSRVREMATKFQEIHDASRRNSQVSLVSTKSSWSRFGADEKDGAGSGRAVGPKRQGTVDSTASGLVSESDYDNEEQREREGSFAGGDGEVTASPVAERPELGGRDASFRPNLPGGWVSYRDDAACASAATPSSPAAAEYSPILPPPDTPVDDDKSASGVAPTREIGQDTTTPRASYEASSSEAPDLTPTTQRTLPATSSGPTHFDQAKTAGTALGASLVASYGLGHQTVDFGSAEPAPAVDQPEMKAKAAIGDLGYAQRPALETRDTDATGVTDIGSVASVPPTPPAKTTPPPPQTSTLGGLAGLPSQQRGALTPDQGQGQGYYFSGAPLRTGRSREGSPDPSRGMPTPPVAAAVPVALPLGAGFVSQPKPGMSPSLSLHPRSTDMESDRLRKEIVRSLEASSSSTPQREKAVEDAERTQDALDAPDNARRVAGGGSALPPAEVTRDVGVPSTTAATTATPQMSTPQRMMLDKRFSFEGNDGEAFGGAFGVAGASAATAAAAATGLGVSGADKDLPPPPTVMEPPAEHSPEIKPEMPYERPRSRGLHIMNADEDDDIGNEDVAREDVVSRGLSVATSSVAPPVSPITKSQENLHLRNVVDATRDGDDGLAPPSPVSEAAGSREFFDNRFSVGRNAPEVYHGEAVPMSTNDADTTTTPTTPTSPKQKIPPFREILAIKSSSDRIKTYEDTRRTFADMNTGLSDWLSGMLAAHPEHASLSTPHGGYNYGASPAAAGDTLGNLKHKQSPSIAKFTRQFSSSGSPTAAAGEGLSSSGGVGEKTTPSKEIDMEKLQQRGKDLMKNASVLGGKAQAGAKGLLAKGKSRFGSTRGGEGGRGSKDPSPSVSQSASSSTLVSNTARGITDPTTDSSTLILQPTPLSASHLSRSNSRGSSFFAPSRSRNQTPSSISSGAAAATGLGSAGPLSRTLSRLRDRSRSHSRSGSRSRPRSLILGNAELLSIQDTSPRFDEKGGGGGVVPLAGSPLISPWIEPDIDGEDRGGDEGDVLVGEVVGGVLPGRLGVLPSPTGGSFSVDLPADGLPEEGKEEGEKVVGIEGGEVLPALDTTPRDLGVGEGKVEEDELYESTPVIENAVPDLGGGDDLDELYDTTPKAARGENREDGVDDDTPRAGQGEWGAGLGATSKAEDVSETDEGVGESQPATTDRDISVSQPETNADQADDLQNTLQPPPVTVLHAPPTVISEGGSDGSILSAGRKSDVSEEVRAEGNEDVVMANPDKPPSRRSDVSSVEAPNRDLAVSRGSEHEQPVMSSQAGPAGPTYSDPPVSRDGISLDGITRDGQDFKIRPQYLSTPAIPRQLSFEQIQQDTDDGGVKQDVLEAPRDLQANVDPADDDRPFEANFTSLTRHRIPSGSQTTDRRSKRLSGFLAGQVPAPPPPSKPLHSSAPSASMISDEYGLEGVQDLHDVPDTALREEEASQKDEKEGRRKSGIWDTFRRTPSTSNAGLSREPSVSKVANPVMMNESVRGVPPQAPSNMRPEPQRASTIATEPGGKKKSRLSGLGSLFGRSSTTGHKSEKGKKLSKSQQPDASGAWQRQQAQQQPPPPQSGGRIGGTEVFMVPPGPRPGWSDPYMQDARPPLGADPPGGWYAPTDERPTFPGPPPPPRQGPPQNFSHPSGYDLRGGFDPRGGMDPRAGFDPRTGNGPRPDIDPRTGFGPPSGIDPRAMGMDPRGIVMDPRRGMQFSNVPESFRPVDASYNRPGMPMRPSDFPRPQAMTSQSFDGPLSAPAGSRMSYPQPQHPSEQQLRPDVIRQRQSSNASTEYSLSPQISGQSEWQRSGWQHRASLPAISPIDSRPGFQAPPPARVESITEEAARSPAREYTDQQTPYNLALPPSNGQAHSTRTSYWARQRRSQKPEGYRSVALQGRGYMGANAYEPGVPIPPSRSIAASPLQFNYPSGSTMTSSYQPVSSFEEARNDSYLSIPTTQTRLSEEDTVRLSQDNYGASSSREEDVPRPQPPISQGVDTDQREASENPPSAQKKDENDNPYLSVQLPNLGHTTTKDAPSDDEETLVFRGASYPGQEWIPAEWE